ncbi:hypothetical protein F4804DRAFT_316175 [Jackrogersella minutella]|nr:hypothetical protein F4804DRAFT_316175 [Jackrogersella minutella]
MSKLANAFNTRPPSDFTRRVANVLINPDCVRLLWAGLTTFTRRSYSTAVRSYELWCRGHQADAWPATSSTLTGWVFDRAFGRSQDRLRGATIEKYLASLHSAHVDINYDIQVFERAHLKRLVGTRR